MNKLITKGGSSLYILSTDKDTHFTGALAQYDSENEDLVGLVSNAIIIRAIAMLSDQNLSYNVVLSSYDGFNNTDLDSDGVVARKAMDIATSGFRIGNTGTYYLLYDNLYIPYYDYDQTKELHVLLENLSVTGKNAGATGEVVLKFLYEPIDLSIAEVSGVGYGAV